jgi:hypothetical protein
MAEGVTITNGLGVAPPRASRELLAAERLLLEGRAGFQRAAPYLLLFANLFANGYLHPLMRDDPPGHVLALFFFLKSSLIAGLFLFHYLTVSESILGRIDHLPVAGPSRFSFVMFGGLRTPAVSGLLATDLLFLVVILRATPAAAAVACTGLTLLVLGSVALVSTGAFLLRRSHYPVTALGALGALGFVALGSALIVFPSSGLLGLVPLVWLTQRAVGAALQGSLELALGLLAALGLAAGAILVLGRKLAGG